MHWFGLLLLFGAVQLAASRKRHIPYKWTVLMTNRARRSRVHHGGQTLQPTYVNRHANLICGASITSIIRPAPTPPMPSTQRLRLQLRLDERSRLDNRDRRGRFGQPFRYLLVVRLHLPHGVDPRPIGILHLF